MPALLDPREEHFKIPSSHAGLSLFLRHLPPPDGISPKGVALYVHGATFPSALSIAHRFDGHSWRDELCDEGFHVWGFDFHGYGHSDAYLPWRNRRTAAHRYAPQKMQASNWRRLRGIFVNVTRPIGYR